MLSGEDYEKVVRVMTRWAMCHDPNSGVDGMTDAELAEEHRLLLLYMEHPGLHQQIEAEANRRVQQSGMAGTA